MHYHKNFEIKIKLIANTSKNNYHYKQGWLGPPKLSFAICVCHCLQIFPLQKCISNLTKMPLINCFEILNDTQCQLQIHFFDSLFKKNFSKRLFLNSKLNFKSWFLRFFSPNQTDALKTYSPVSKLLYFNIYLSVH